MKRMCGLIKKVFLLGVTVFFLAFSVNTLSLAASPPKTAKTKAAKENKKVQKVDVNAADVKELRSLPGIGKKTAENIIAYRKASGPFKTPEDLLKVKGIGKKTLKKIENLIILQ